MTSSPARRASIFSESMMVKTYGGRELIRRNSMGPRVPGGPRPPGTGCSARRRRLHGAERSTDGSGVGPERGHLEPRPVAHGTTEHLLGQAGPGALEVEV